MIHLDTNVLVALADPTSTESRTLSESVLRGEQLGISSVAWTAYLCGPVLLQERQTAQAMLGKPEPLTDDDAALAAYLFNQLGRRRGSLLDCMIAAIAIRSNAHLFTRNMADFAPMEALGLSLYSDHYS